MIYFAQLESGPIKIGCSADINVRISDLKSYYGQQIDVLHTMPGDRATEQKIHERFAHLRIGRSEQFQPGADLVEFIGKPMIVDVNPDTVEMVHPKREILDQLRVTAESVKVAKKAAALKEMTLTDYASAALIDAANRDIADCLKTLTRKPKRDKPLESEGDKK